MPFATILASPVTYHPVATDADTGAATDLAPLLDGPAALRRALQASSTLPVLAGPPVALAGRVDDAAGRLGVRGQGASCGVGAAARL